MSLEPEKEEESSYSLPRAVCAPGRCRLGQIEYTGPCLLPVISTASLTNVKNLINWRTCIVFFFPPFFEKALVVTIQCLFSVSLYLVLI